MVRIIALSFAAGILLLCAGCGQQGPTYAEALQTYTAEMQELQRLQAERDRVQQSAETAGLADLIGGSLLGSDLNLSKQDLESIQSGSMDKFMDKALPEAQYRVWYAERVKRGEQLPDPEAETEAINKEHARLKLPVQPGIAREAKAHEAQVAKTKARDESLAKLDAQIAVQKERVEHARAVKDEAEARSR